VQQHVLDDGICTLAVLNDLIEIAPQGIREFSDCSACLIALTFSRVSSNSSISSTEIPEKLLTKFSGFLISWAMPAVNWASETSFWVCTKRSWVVR
jgi:hypothetical protein